MGMQLIFISREDYREKILSQEINEDVYIINEGGYGIKGAEGISTIAEHCELRNYTHICCAAGTGTMAAGLAMAAQPQTSIIAISVMKYNPEIERNIHALMTGYKKEIEVIHDYHFGGYAKFNPELIHFMNEFYSLTAIPSDFVYTGKLFYAIHGLIATGYFPVGSRLLVIHSGGLQGNASLNKGTLIF